MLFRSCVSDQIDPLVYSSAAKDYFKDIDLVLCAGDLPMEYVDYIVSVLNKPTYFVFGNHNLEEFHYYHGKRDTSFIVKPHYRNSLGLMMTPNPSKLILTCFPMLRSWQPSPRQNIAKAT